MNERDAAVRRWLAKAENDLLNIRNNLHASRVPWEWKERLRGLA